VTLTFTAEADTYVQADTATTNYGTENRLVVDGGPVRRSFLKFAVTGITGRVTRAVLRVHTVADNEGSPSGGRWRGLTDTTWSETAVTWDEQPAIDGDTFDELGVVTHSTWYEIDVTALVIAGNGTYSIAATSTRGDGAYFDSREAGPTGPQLVVTVESAG